MSPLFKQVQYPELIFGIAGPIGVDMGQIVNELSNSLRRHQYESAAIQLTELMLEFPVGIEIDQSNLYTQYKTKIEYANAVRRKLDEPSALAMIAVSAIRQARLDKTGDFEKATEKQAYIVRQIKRPEEVSLLRTVYGKHFILISAHVPHNHTLEGLTQKIKRGTAALLSDADCRKFAENLIAIDKSEKADRFGQNLEDAFPLADVFIDATSRSSIRGDVDRFIDLVFGSNSITPTRAEYGMYMAKSASLRSSDLSRQVGAAIVRDSGEILTMGCNEVPKAGGGTYWTGDKGDSRDMVKGHDPNDEKKREVVADFLQRLFDDDLLNKDKVGNKTIDTLTGQLTDKKTNPRVAESRIMDIIEFGRIIHAEMCAITDAARLGISIQDASLYCTTFPCHMCAKHIVSSGLKTVVYIEPYPKSYAIDLHGDAISLSRDDRSRVRFMPFSGISPFRYRDFFEKGKRKYSGGGAMDFIDGEPRPRVDTIYPPYFAPEAIVADSLSTHFAPAATK